MKEGRKEGGEEGREEGREEVQEGGKEREGRNGKERRELLSFQGKEGRKQKKEVKKGRNEMK